MSKNYLLTLACASACVTAVNLDAALAAHDAAGSVVSALLQVSGIGPHVLTVDAIRGAQGPCAFPIDDPCHNADPLFGFACGSWNANGCSEICACCVAGGTNSGVCEWDPNYPFLNYCTNDENCNPWQDQVCAAPGG